MAKENPTANLTLSTDYNKSTTISIPIKLREDPDFYFETILDLIKKRFASEKFINNVCVSFSHDFFLLDNAKQEDLTFHCKEWMRAIVNNWEYFEEEK